jgi:putative flavoprotein involved in K+ transport
MVYYRNTTINDARAVVSATGTHARPFVPDVLGRGDFRGLQIHSSEYRRAEPLRGRRVLVVGGGNSGAQIMAEVSAVASHAAWSTLVPPRFLPDDMDGRVLFDYATARLSCSRRPPPHASPCG